MRYTLSCALILLATLPACIETAPEHFDSLADLVAFHQKEGYVKIEHFGDAWPAKVVYQRQHRDEVTVILANSEAYSYDEHPGHRLRVVKLRGKQNAEIVVVFRSAKKE